MNTIKTWLSAFRLKTLPLAFSCILMGSLINGANMQKSVLLLALLTTLFLQILSNLANDYGDYVSGVDNDNRVGPERTMQQGAITKKQMTQALVIFSLLSLFSGVFLIFTAFPAVNFYFFIFLFIGITAIAAAIKYTMGSNPYGYKGFGDLFVFIFFGLVGVLGTSFLHQQILKPDFILPAIAVGFLSVGVLNLNNLRDIENDRTSGKNTLVVKLGYKGGKIYHGFLLGIALISTLSFNLINELPAMHYLFILVTPIWFKQIITVKNCVEPELLDPELKKLAISTLLFTLFFGIPFIL